MSNDERAVYLNKDILQTIHSGLPRELVHEIHSYLPTQLDHWLDARIEYIRHCDMSADPHCNDFGGGTWSVNIFGPHPTCTVSLENSEPKRYHLHVTGDLGWGAVVPVLQDVHFDCPPWEDLPCRLSYNFKALQYFCKTRIPNAKVRWEEEPSIHDDLPVQEPFYPIPTVEELEKIFVP